MIITTVNSFEQLEAFNKMSNISRYVVGNEEFAMRLGKSFSIDEIKKVLESAHENNKEVFVNVSRIFHEREIDILDDYLLKLSEINVDGIIFSDLGVIEVIKKHNLKFKKIYSTDTTITNSYFSELAHASGIEAIEMAKEITLKEVIEVNANKKSEIIIPFHGAIMMYQSARDLVTNYEEHVGLKFKREDNDLYLYDEERDKYYYLYENKYGSYILSSDYLTGVRYLEQIINEGIDYISIEALTYTDEEIINCLSIYNDAIDYCKENSDSKSYLRQCEKDIKSTNELRRYTTGFLNKKTMY